MDDARLALVGLLQLHVVVGMLGELLVVRHGVVGLLEHVVAGGAEGDKVLSLLLCAVERAHGGQLACDFILAHGEGAAAALPLAQLLQVNAQLFRGKAGVAIQVLRLVLQRAAGIVTKVHSFPFP